MSAEDRAARRAQRTAFAGASREQLETGLSRSAARITELEELLASAAGEINSLNDIRTAACEALKTGSVAIAALQKENASLREELGKAGAALVDAHAKDLIVARGPAAPIIEAAEPTRSPISGELKFTDENPAS